MIVIRVFVGFLALLSAAMGFAAEGMRTRGRNVEYPSSGCNTPPEHAALASAGILTLAMLIFVVGVLVDCHRREKRQPHQPSNESPSHQPNDGRLAVGFICIVLSVLSYFIATYLLLDETYNEFPGDDRHTSSCSVAKPGVFAAGAVLALATVLFSIISNIILTSPKINPAGVPSSPTHDGIEMGQPQLLP